MQCCEAAGWRNGELCKEFKRATRREWLRQEKSENPQLCSQRRCIAPNKKRDQGEDNEFSNHAANALFGRLLLLLGNFHVRGLAMCAGASEAHLSPAASVCPTARISTIVELRSNPRLARREGEINQTLRLGLTLLNHQTRIAPTTTTKRIVRL
jgi:hypothetical protein